MALLIDSIAVGVYLYYRKEVNAFVSDLVSVCDPATWNPPHLRMEEEANAKKDNRTAGRHDSSIIAMASVSSIIDRTYAFIYYR